MGQHPTMTDLDRATFMLEEAFRCLRRHTGMINWEKAIASRIDCGFQSKTCPECNGDRYVRSTSMWEQDCDPNPCTRCGQSGYVLVPLDPIEIVKLPPVST
jgi:hypothetical protein